MYDPILGRWLEQDPIGLDAGDMDLYRMEGNNPTNELDPSGLKVTLYLSTAVPSESSPLGYHVSIIVGPDSTGKYVRYDGGGEDDIGSDGRPVPKRREIFPNDPQARHRTLPKRETKTEVISPYKTADEEIKKLDEVFKKLRQLPYCRTGPNSNTYAKQLLKLAGFKVEPTFETRTHPISRGGHVLRDKVEVGATTTWGWKDESYGGSDYDEWGHVIPKPGKPGWIYYYRIKTDYGYIELRSYGEPTPFPDY